MVYKKLSEMKNGDKFKYDSYKTPIVFVAKHPVGKGYVLFKGADEDEWNPFLFSVPDDDEYYEIID